MADPEVDALVQRIEDANAPRLSEFEKIALTPAPVDPVKAAELERLTAENNARRQAWGFAVVEPSNPPAPIVIVPNPTRLSS